MSAAYFFDTSALVKRYLVETGSSWVYSTVKRSSQNLIFIAELTLLECVSAIVRQQQKGKLTTRSVQAATILLERHATREYDVLLYDSNVQWEAQHIILTTPLRTLDAIQMASANIIAQDFRAYQMPLPIFVSADQKLLDVATQLGFPVENPNLYP